VVNTPLNLPMSVCLSFKYFQWAYTCFYARWQITGALYSTTLFHFISQNTWLLSKTNRNY